MRGGGGWRGVPELLLMRVYLIEAVRQLIQVGDFGNIFLHRIGESLSKIDLLDKVLAGVVFNPLDHLLLVGAIGESGCGPEYFKLEEKVDRSLFPLVEAVELLSS